MSGGGMISEGERVRVSVARRQSSGVEGRRSGHRIRLAKGLGISSGLGKMIRAHFGRGRAIGLGSVVVVIASR